MIPNFPNPHPVFDRWPVVENFPCPVSGERLKAFQKQLNRIGGVASNGKPNIRIVWAADPETAMHVVNGEPKARYALRTDQYECKRIDKETNLEIVEFVDVDVCLPRFIVEQYHTPEEESFNPSGEPTGNGYYTHLFTVAHHDEGCCGGREAVNGQLCLGAYEEPSESHLDHLRHLIRLRDETKQTRMIGEQITEEEFAEDRKHLKDWNERRDEATKSSFADIARQSLKLHGWRMSSGDGGKRSKFHFLNG